MIRIYSLLVLLYDIVYLGIFTGYSIFQSIWHTFFPKPQKSVRDEVAVVSTLHQLQEVIQNCSITLINPFLNFPRSLRIQRLSVPVEGSETQSLSNWELWALQ